MMMLKEQFKKLNNHVAQKKAIKDEDLQDRLTRDSTPRFTSTSSNQDSSIKNLKRTSFNSVQTSMNASNYTYDSSYSNKIPSSYLHQLKTSLPQLEKGVYQLSTSQLNKVLDSWFATPLPNSSRLFPYLHGAINQIQCDFLELDKDDIPNIRYLLIIKSNDVNNFTLIKSTITLDDIVMEKVMDNSCLINLRNYSSQITLLSKVSDFVIYNEDNNLKDNLTLAHKLKSINSNHYNTYILNYDSKSLSSKYKINQDLTKLDPAIALHYTMNNWNMNYMFHERVEMWLMTSKIQIHPNLFLGNANDLHPENTSEHEFQLIINCHEGVYFPDEELLDEIMDYYDGCDKVELDFSCSGSYSADMITDLEISKVLKVCKLIHHYTEVLGAKCFIYCFDGYSAFSLLVIAYEMYKNGCGLVQAMLNYFLDYKKCLYYFKNDYEVLKSLEGSLIENSPSKTKPTDAISLASSINSMKLSQDEDQIMLEDWLSSSTDKNPPSRIFSHLYLGTFEHACCSTLWKKIGITQMISFGQIPTWMDNVDLSLLNIEKHYSDESMDGSNIIYIYNNPIPGLKKLIHVPYLEDDGKCSILLYFEKIYKLIKTGSILPLNNEINLVHCRVGVSRSATFCILETMKSLQVSVARAYLYVRVRRLNVIIQPNLKIFYELLKIEQSMKKGREIEWHILCREIDYLNRRYF